MTIKIYNFISVRQIFTENMVFENFFFTKTKPCSMWRLEFKTPVEKEPKNKPKRKSELEDRLCSGVEDRRCSGVED